MSKKKDISKVICDMMNDIMGPTFFEVVEEGFRVLLPDDLEDDQAVCLKKIGKYIMLKMFSGDTIGEDLAEVLRNDPELIAVLIDALANLIFEGKVKLPAGWEMSEDRSLLMLDGTPGKDVLVEALLALARTAKHRGDTLMVVTADPELTRKGAREYADSLLNVQK